MADHWKLCSSCKSEIPYSTPYWVCSVSTCTRKRTGMVFCSVSCWEAHLPMMRHREAYAVEARSPSQAEWLREQQKESSPATGVASNAPTSGTAASAPAVRRRVASEPTSAEASEIDEVSDDDLPRDILVISSKLKAYIRARAGMNTSDGVLDVLSDHLRALCRQAIRNAAQDGRKTVLDRDIPRPPRP